MKERLFRFTVDLPIELHQMLKKFSVDLQTSMRNVVIDAINEKIIYSKIDKKVENKEAKVNNSIVSKSI